MFSLDLFIYFERIAEIEGERERERGSLSTSLYLRWSQWPALCQDEVRRHEFYMVFHLGVRSPSS